jgi:hypothetical protein
MGWSPDLVSMKFLMRDGRRSSRAAVAGVIGVILRMAIARMIGQSLARPRTLIPA